MTKQQGCKLLHYRRKRKNDASNCDLAVITQNEGIMRKKDQVEVIFSELKTGMKHTS